jgi:hypothetical protein
MQLEFARHLEAVSGGRGRERFCHAAMVTKPFGKET